MTPTGRTHDMLAAITRSVAECGVWPCSIAKASGTTNILLLLDLKYIWLFYLRFLLYFLWS